jgi:hypothetical protein
MSNENLNLFEMMGIETEKEETPKKKDVKKSTATKVEVKETKYTLPIKVYYIDEYELTSEDFGGLEEVTEVQVIECLRDRYELFMFDEKRVILDYMEDRNTLVAILKSPRKGGVSRVKVDGRCRWFFESDYMSFTGGKAPDSEFVEKALREPFFELAYGKIPLHIFGEIVCAFAARLPNEYLAAIFVDKEKGEYFVAFPEQEVSGTSVKRERGYLCYENDVNKPLVCEIHSHQFMTPLAFSKIDDYDEVHFKIYGIVGFELWNKQQTSCKFRIGTRGTFRDIEFDDIFGGM